MSYKWHSYEDLERLKRELAHKSLGKERSRFFNTVLDVKSYLIKMRQNMNSALAPANRWRYLNQNVSTFEKRMKFIDNLLKTQYFDKENLHLRVSKFMIKLNAEEKIYEDEISRLESKVNSMDVASLERADDFSDSFCILDEYDEQSDVTSMSQQEQEMNNEIELAALHEYKEKLKVCKDLKEIIRDPKRFFSGERFRNKLRR